MKYKQTVMLIKCWQYLQNFLYGWLVVSLFDPITITVFANEYKPV